MKMIALLLLSLIALTGQAPNQSPQAQPTAASAGAQLPAVRHLVYRFGYNTKATDSGQGTGTTTIDITGPAKDGGMIVNATDSWWNTVRPRQTSTCEVYPNGGVNCAQAPYSLSPIQVVIVPLLAQKYFSALSSGSNASWNQTFTVKATFLPGASGLGFAGQVYTWNCAYALNGAGTMPNNAPLILIRSDGAMTQQGGRNIVAKQKSNIVVDPRIHMPVIVTQEITFVPQLSVSRYTVDLRLLPSQS
jgi:hypothetical protein